MQRHEVTVKCEHNETFFGRLTLCFLEVHRDAVITEIRLSAGPCNAIFGVTLLGYDLSEFVKELEMVYASLEGTARLAGADIEIEFAVVDKGSGRIRISGQIFGFIDWYGEVKLAFSGLMTDQSYLPELIRGLKSFLAESGVSLENPWAKGCP